MKTYFCYLEYFATGEGLTFSMGIVFARDKKSATRKFCEKYMCSESIDNKILNECVSYFSPATKVYDLKNKKENIAIRNIMKDFFTEKVIDHTLDATKNGALMDFYYNSYVNYS